MTGITELDQDPTGGDPSGDDADLEAGAASQDDLTADPDPKDDGVTKKINKLTRKRREAERAAADAKAEAAYYKGLAEGGGSGKEETKTVELDRLDFDSDSDYHKAIAKQAREEIRVEETARIKREENEKNRNKINAQYDEGRDKYADFDEVALDTSLPITSHMFEAAGGKFLTEILYHLGKNPEKAARISAMSPIAQAKEIGRIEDTINPPKKKVTKAPSPPGIVSGVGVNLPTQSEQEMLDAGSRSSLHAKWNKERKERLGA